MRIRELALALVLGTNGCYVRAESGVRVTAGETVWVERADEDPAALTTFEPVLSPYGVFVEDGVWGTVWVPDGAIVGADFEPYVTSGHWAYTDEGYYWVSDYPWGWAPFHYGRWVWTAAYGWVWIPGARHSPAWVEWRTGGGYVGWAPAPPYWCFRHGVVVYFAPPPPPPFVFVASVSFFAPHPRHHVIRGEAAPEIVERTRPWASPPPPPHGHRPFVGPDPHAAGIPDDHVKGAHIAVPNPGKPGNVPWKPAAPPHAITPLPPKAEAPKIEPPVIEPPNVVPPKAAPAPKKPKSKPTTPLPVKPKVPKAPS